MNDVIAVGATVSQERRIRSALSDNGAALRSWAGALEGREAAGALVAEEPAVIVLGPQLEKGALELALQINELNPMVATLLIAKSDTEMLQKALASGVRGVLEPDAKKDAFKEALDRVLAAGERMRERAVQSEDRPVRHRFITVVSAKGGAGKTVISSNLAVSLAEESDRETVLVDLDLQFGDAATALLLTPTYSMADAAHAAKSGLDAAALKVFLSRHSPSDLYVLCAPDEPSAGEDVPVGDITSVLHVLHEEFRHVVIDTDPGLSESTLTALELATDIVVVADLDVPSVRGTRKLLEALDTIGMKGATRHLVLNRADSRVGLTPEEVEEAVGASIDVKLPSTRQVPISLNEGDPMVMSAPRSPFAKQFTALARRMATLPARKGIQR